MQHSTAQPAEDLLDTQLAAYSERAARRRARPSTAEVLGCTAAAGGLAFAGGDALGAIVHKTDTVSVSFNTATATSYAGAAWDITGTGGASGGFGAGPLGIALVGFGYLPGNWVGYSAGLPFASALAPGESVGTGAGFFGGSEVGFAALVGATTLGGFLNTAAYAGFRFQIGQDPAVFFGWAKVRVDFAADPGRVALTACEWAYDDTGAAIDVGDRGTGSAVPCPSYAFPAPAPATPLLTLLGLGAMGVAAYRRRREEGLKRLADEQDQAAA